MKRIIIFFPLLILYISIILIFSSPELIDDEPRYLKFAENLTNGYYTLKDNIDLTNAPGYPLFLLPFVALKIPLIIPKLMNAVFIFLAVLYFYHTLRLYTDKKSAFIFAYLLGIYPLILKWIFLLYTESLAYFLVCGFVFHFCRLIKNKPNSWCQIIITSLYLGFLTLTRAIFGYVILFGLLFFLISYFVIKKPPALKSVLVFFAAFVLCIPYLAYTYSLTGRVFYWTSNGGELLYWISTPYQDEYGEWFKEEWVNDPGDYPELYKNHANFFKKLAPLSKFQRDEIFRKRAIDNIIHHPVKYFQNWIANLGRLLFNYPYSYTPQTLYKYFHIIPNMFLVFIALLCLYPSYLSRRMIPSEIKTVMVFALIYLGGSSLVSTRSRYFLIVVPIIALWLSYVLLRFVKIEINK